VIDPVDLFGQYAVLIGQLLALVTIAGLLIHTARWIVARKQGKHEAITYFIILMVVIVTTAVFATARSVSEIQQLQAIENQNLALNIQQVKNQNLTLQNQELLRQLLSHESRPVVANNDNNNNIQPIGKPIIELKG